MRSLTILTASPLLVLALASPAPGQATLATAPSPENLLFAVPEGQPLAGLRICVDAGHGGQIWGRARGYTGGTRGAVSGLTESEANLRTALFLWDLLTQAGAQVVMTRTFETRLSEDCTDPPDSEAFSANRRRELGIRPQVAEANDCDLLVSIHHNAVGDPEVNFTTAFHFDPAQHRREEGEPTVSGLSSEEVETAREVAESILECLSRRLDLPTRPVRHGDYLILRESSIPAVIVECSFMTNPEEDARLQSLGRSRLEAIGIFEGLLAHFAPSEAEKTTGEVTP